MFGSGTTTLAFLNEDLNDIMKTIKSLTWPGLLTKGITKTTKNEAKKQMGGFLSMLLGTLGASLLGNMLVGKSTIKAAEGTIIAGKETNRAGQDSNRQIFS